MAIKIGAQMNYDKAKPTIEQLEQMHTMPNNRLKQKKNPSSFASSIEAIFVDLKSNGKKSIGINAPNNMKLSKLLSKQSITIILLYFGVLCMFCFITILLTN